MNKRVSEMTPEELAKYRARARERRRLMIEKMTPEELAEFNAYNSARHKRYLESMPPEKRKEMKKKWNAARRLKIANMSPEEREEMKNSPSKEKWRYWNLTPEQKEARRMSTNKSYRKRIQNATPEQREKMLEKNREISRKHLRTRTEEAVERYREKARERSRLKDKEIHRKEMAERFRMLRQQELLRNKAEKEFARAEKKTPKEREARDLYLSPYRFSLNTTIPQTDYVLSYYEARRESLKDLRKLNLLQQKRLVQDLINNACTDERLCTPALRYHELVFLQQTMRYVLASFPSYQRQEQERARQAEYYHEKAKEFLTQK